MILDTNAVSALALKDRALIEKLKFIPQLTIPVIVVGEYMYGLKRVRNRSVLEKWFQDLCNLCDIADINEETALYYAQAREELRVQGSPIPENDIWIAASARQLGLSIVSKDKHFDFVSGITRVIW